ncbi:CACTA en-spm transposon protein [Cucumis melo var. makuwa]|uniref:CACTA en-spm transposon protein n=1 Tax=Cucumis melo var. makuwa TaxID=1194695 RepID=A0A5D3DYB1_CUCMM|nr:CACTA en-spm transposon protein [Cucumis melo var. makuwa]TYK28349.1 CACTA en-spm transposon protein [Cucumis melo var. makuwa]
MDEHIEDDTLCRTDVNPIIVERPIVHHVADNFIDDGDEQFTMSSFSSNFDEIDAIFLEFTEDLNNLAGGSSSMDNNLGTTQPSPTPRRRAQSRLLELERYVHTNGKILMSIASSMEKPISPHVVRLSQAIGMCIRNTFSICCIRWADVGREYIEASRATYRHFKKYNNSEETRANPPHILVECMEDWYFLYAHYISRAFQEQSRTYKLLDRSNFTIITTGRSHFYNGNTSSSSKESQPTSDGSQPLSRDEICETVLGRRSGYSKDLGWGPKPKFRKMDSTRNATTLCSQSTVKLQLWVELDEAKQAIEEQRKTQEMLASQVEQMWKLALWSHSVE